MANWQKIDRPTHPPPVSDTPATEARQRLNLSVSEETQNDDYEVRVAAEKVAYSDCLNVHDLPEIFHYWSNRYLRPRLQAFGFTSPEEMFRKYFEEQCKRNKGKATHFISIGSGNCDLEVDLASHLRSKGYDDFAIDCLDLNASMLERGRAAAAKAGVSGQISCVQADFNRWTAVRKYNAVIANQTLHHVLNLEGLFAQIKSHLKQDGCFIISDMIGRNGHQRWPEALEIVHEFWRKLPPSFRYNQELERYEELFHNWDCSADGFEGIRSQDVLPLLLRQFHFRLFVGFGNIIDPFVDRSFGHNFDAATEWDRSFIDAVQQRDEAEIAAGRIKPTHMLAVVGNDPGEPVTFHANLSPQFCVRPPDAVGEILENRACGTATYRWGEWPHSAQIELEIACQRLNDAACRIVDLKKAVQERTDWALALKKELDRTAGVRRLYLYLQTAYNVTRHWGRRLGAQAGRLRRG